MNECYGIPAELIARLCKVDVATARRWKRGATRPPETAKMILSADLGVFDPAFTGWKLRDGQLISPEGWSASPGDILALPLMRAQIASYQADQRRNRVLAMDEQPEPGAAPEIFTNRVTR
jgi:hypothetical protein